MEKEYYIINGELYHGGKGSGRKPDPNSISSRAKAMNMSVYEYQNRFMQSENKRSGIDDNASNAYRSYSKTNTNNSTDTNITSNKTSTQQTSNKSNNTNKTVNSNKSNSERTNVTNLDSDPSKYNDEDLKKINSRQEQEAKFRKNNPPEPTVEEKRLNIVNEAKKFVDDNKRAVDGIQVKRERMNLDNMTNKQLTDRIERERLERQYNDYFSKPSKMEKAKSKVSSILAAAGTILGVAGSALSIALMIKKAKD